MAMLIPKYLEDIATEISSNHYSIFLDIKCICGNDEFELSKNNRNKEKELEYDLWIQDQEHYWKNIHPHVYSTVPYVDKKDGKMYEYGRTIFGIRIGKYCIEDKPEYDRTCIIKAICSKCGKEHIILDNRLYGIDAFLNKKPKKDELTFHKYRHFESLDQIFKLQIEANYDFSFDKLQRKLKTDLNLRTYSNLFTKINIFGFVHNNKKILIHSEGTLQFLTSNKTKK